MDLILSVLPYLMERCVALIRTAFHHVKRPSTPSHRAAFSTPRVYALSGRDWRFAALVCLLMTGPIVGNIVRTCALVSFVLCPYTLY